MDLSIDTKARKVMLDGKPLDTVTEISFLWNTNGVSSVTLTADVDIRMESEIFEEAYKEIYCSKCGTYIGKISSERENVRIAVSCIAGATLIQLPPGNNHFGIRETSAERMSGVLDKAVTNFLKFVSSFNIFKYW